MSITSPPSLLQSCTLLERQNLVVFNALFNFSGKGRSNPRLISSGPAEKISSGVPSLTSSPLFHDKYPIGIRCFIDIMCDRYDRQVAFFFDLLIVEITSSRPSGSNMLVASSKMMISGRNATTPAIATRCFCPPDNRAGSLFAKSLIRTFQVHPLHEPPFLHVGYPDSQDQKQHHLPLLIRQTGCQDFGKPCRPFDV